ncbi:MAG: hypothetical protein SAJ37_07215 [Oscillatoria sp. PMC 1068.18]|nr:hypothetical protein [Oscillatoria sp. PMC 1076.18]MEC4988522.1 hypothetical protein [Oscillatoria sp. PMC 1068.18]
MSAKTYGTKGAVATALITVSFGLVNLTCSIFVPQLIEVFIYVFCFGSQNLCDRKQSFYNSLQKVAIALKTRSSHQNQKEEKSRYLILTSNLSEHQIAAIHLNFDA